MVEAIASGTNQIAGALAALANPRTFGQRPCRGSDCADSSESRVEAVGSRPVGKAELTEEERQEVEELERRDREVRQHEQAHKAAAGGYAKGGPSYEYETGPDGKQYAVGGQVQIDTSEVPGDPKATIQKMRVVQRAASAPAEPSAEDRQVAAKAAQIEQQARAELTAEQQQGPGSPGESDPNFRPEGTAAQDSPTVEPTGDSPRAPAASPTDPSPQRQLQLAAEPAVATLTPPVASRSGPMVSYATLSQPGRFLDVRV